MNRLRVYLLHIVAAGVGVLSFNVRADDPRPYLRAGIGPAFTESARLKEFFTAPVAGARIKYETGFRMDVAGGYQVTDWFAAEVQSGMIYNEADSVAGSSTDDLRFYHVPLLVNVLFQYPNRTGLTPFICGGGGVSLAVVDADDYRLGGIRFDGSAADAVGAYQAFAGVRYRINDQFTVGVAYKYFGTGDPSWKPDVISGTSGRFRAEGFSSHSVVAQFNFRF